MSHLNAHRTVFVVEDNPKISAVLRDYLIDGGYRVQVFRAGGPALDAAKADPPALIVLDLMLPGMDGLAVCGRLRQFSATPVLMLTARVEEGERIAGLEAGADDYVCKPFSVREVMARVAALIRRAEGRVARAPEETGNLFLNEITQRVGWRGVWLNLSPSEYRILAHLMKQPGRVFSREQLLEHVSLEFRDVSDRSIDSHIKNIRRKIAALDPDSATINSVYGVGYRFEP